MPVEVPDLKLTTPGFGVQGCGCSVQTCCDAINASGGYFAGYLGCAPVEETRGEICDQVTAGKLDGSLSVCDVPELANGPAQLTTTLKMRSDDKSYENQVCTRLARTTRLARYLVKFHPGPRRSVASRRMRTRRGGVGLEISY